MSSTLRTFAYYDFPVPISVLAEVLGSAMPTRIGRAEAVIYTPGALSNEQIDPWPKAPFIKDGPGSNAWASFQPTDWAVTHAGDYEIDGESVPATRLLRIAIELLDPADDLPTHPEEFGRSDTRASLYAHDGIDQWMESVRTWVEVATGQDLDRNHRLYDMTQHGDGLHFWRDGDWITEDRRSIVTSVIRPLDLLSWTKILKAVGDDREPPIEFILARDAWSAFARNAFRQAALNAGTAVEVILHQMYVDKADRLRARHVTIRDQDRRNLSTLKEDLQEAQVDLGVADADLQELIDARNTAAHRGTEVPFLILRSCLQTMSAFLSLNGPRNLWS